MQHSEVQALFDVIASEARKIDPKIQIEAMGSFRRGEETSGDLDCLITRDTSDGKTHSGKLVQHGHDLLSITSGTGLVGKLVDRLSATGFITHHVSELS